MWQRLSWWFGYQEACIVAIPLFGIVTQVIPVFSRKPILRIRSERPAFDLHFRTFPQAESEHASGPIFTVASPFTSP